MQPALAQTESRSPLRLAVQSPLGRVWIAAFAAAALYPGLGYLAALVASAIGLASFFPARRRWILSALAIYICARNLAPQVMTGAVQLTSNHLRPSNRARARFSR